MNAGRAGAEASPLTRALVLTREMLAAAQAADWERLLQLEQTRAPMLLRQHLDDVVSRAQVGLVLAYDRQLQALLGNAQDAVARQWQNERARSHAIAAYAHP